MLGGSKKSAPNVLIALAWLVYATCYLGKVNYSANIVQIVDYYGVTKAEAGVAPTFFFFAYGIGQIVNGLLCKKYNIKWMVFAGLFGSAVMNFAVAITDSFQLIKCLWLCNGFLLSILYPSLIRVLTESLPRAYLGKSSVILGTTIGTGTLVIYALSSLYTAFDQFKLAFYTAAIAEATVSIVWVVQYGKTVSRSRAEMTSDDVVASIDNNVQGTHRSAIKVTVLLPMCVLCACAVCSNLIKDGLTTWGPSILNEEGSLGGSISILLTLFLPIVAIFGNAFAVRMHKRVPNYIIHCLIVFACIALVVGAVIGSIALGVVAVMLLGMVIVNFLASSLNSLITSVFPMFMRSEMNSGLCAGLLNASAYLGSTISSYGLGVIADRFGWQAVFYCFLIACGAICICCAITGSIHQRNCSHAGYDMRVH